MRKKKPTTPPDYVVPPAVLNVAKGNNGDYGSMPCRDQRFPIPDEWIEANARRFYVTDRQILDAAVTEFETPDLPEFARCYLVYFLIRCKEIIYVGMSKDFDRRLETHLENGMPFDSFAWLEVPEMYMKAIEAYYIDRMQPIYNNHFPRVYGFGNVAKTFEEPGQRKPKQDRIIVVTARPALPRPPVTA